MTDDLNASMKEYLEKLKTEQAMYRQVFSYAEKERCAVEKMDIRELKGVLLAKEELLTKIETIEKEVANLRSVWKEAQDHIESALSGEINLFLKDFAVFVKKIVEYEAETEKMFIEKNEQKEKELGAVRKARQANRAYFKTPEIPPRKTDILG